MKFNLKSLVGSLIARIVTKLVSKFGLEKPIFSTVKADASMARQRDPNSQFSTTKREQWLRKKNLETLHKSFEKKMTRSMC